MYWTPTFRTRFRPSGWTGASSSPIPPDRLGHPADHRLGAGKGSALGQQEAGFDDVALDVGEGPELELPTRHHGKRRDEQGDNQAHRQVAPGNRGVDEAPDDPFGESGKSGVEPGPQAPAPRPVSGTQGPHQVVGQDEERLDQTERQGEDEDHRQDGEDRPDVPPQEREHTEHRDGGEERGEHPRRHLLRAGDGRVERGEPGVAVAGDVLRDHDGIVHQEAHRDQQRHHGDHVEGVTGPGHARDGPHECDREPGGYPERIAEPEEEPHHQEHEAEPLHAVAEQHRQPVADDGRDVARDLEDHAGRGTRPLGVDMGPERVDDVEDVVALALLHGEECGPAVH